MFDPCTIHEVTIPSYSDSLFQTGVHLSRIDSKTGYNDYDPRDQPELEKETLRKKMKRYKSLNQILNRLCVKLET
jgi:hypothetical protein